MNKVLLVIFLGCAFLLTACDSGGKYASYSDQKVKKEYIDCSNSGRNMSPARGVACGNYEKECERRKKKGKNICSI